MTEALPHGAYFPLPKPPVILRVVRNPRRPLQISTTPSTQPPRRRPFEGFSVAFSTLPLPSGLSPVRRTVGNGILVDAVEKKDQRDLIAFVLRSTVHYAKCQYYAFLSLLSGSCMQILGLSPLKKLKIMETAREQRIAVFFVQLKACLSLTEIRKKKRERERDPPAWLCGCEAYPDSEIV